MVISEVKRRNFFFLISLCFVIQVIVRIRNLSYTRKKREIAIGFIAPET